MNYLIETRISWNIKRALSMLAVGVVSVNGQAGDLTAEQIKEKIDPQLRNVRSLNNAPLEALIEVKNIGNKISLEPNQHYLASRHSLVDQLQSNTQIAQSEIVKYLKDQGIEHKIFWINNTIFVRASQAALSKLAARNDVTFIYGNPAIAMRKPIKSTNVLNEPLVAGVEWGVDKVNAPKVWAKGITGQGVTIAGEDTGYQWDHPAIKGKYRGWNGTSVNHSYNWHDAAHSGSSSCGANAKAPCDDHGHGTHTVGTMVGDGGAGNQIGVAPGAKWIGCRNMISGVGTPATYTECLQWLVAPTDINGNNPDPSKAPDISSHSWGCTTSEGCTSASALKTAVENVVNAGIMVIAAAGNDGSNCSTITDPPGIHDAAFTIASSTNSNAMSGFSSRGPVASAVTNKPDITAPGSDVRSSWPGNSYSNLSGTSMATPHVAGVAALIIAANPTEYRGKPAKVAAVLRASASHNLSNSQSCGGIAATSYPNPVVGAGLIDAYAAYVLATGIVVPPTVLAKNVPVSISAATGEQLKYTFVVPTPPPSQQITNLSFKMVGGTGDGDIYTQLGSAPTTTSYLAKSNGSSNTEAILIAAPIAGTYHVLMDAYAAVNGATLVASYQTGTIGGNVLTSGVPVTGITLALNATKTYSIVVPSGKTSLTFKLTGGTGDGDIFAKFGTAPTTTSYDMKSDGSTNSESITISAPKAGTYYLLLKAYAAVNGTTLTATIN